jgi:hypothetical protein
LTAAGWRVEPDATNFVAQRFAHRLHPQSVGIAHRAEISKHKAVDGGIVGGFEDGTTHADVVERLRIDLHAADKRLRGRDCEDMDVGKGSRQLELIDSQFEALNLRTMSVVNPRPATQCSLASS